MILVRRGTAGELLLSAGQLRPLEQNSQFST